jgi:Glutaredoxin-like domain (DUF836)
MMELAAVLGPQAANEVVVIDITDDDELERRYGAKIPVLTADDSFVCSYHLDHDRVAAYFDK